MKRVLPAMTYKLWDEWYVNMGDMEIIVYENEMGELGGINFELSKEVIEYLKEEENQ